MSALDASLKTFFMPEDLWVVALSGGPDSMALFYALKKLSQKMVVAHVDHGWRPESSQEADLLREWVGDTPFCLKRYNKNDFHGNLEQEGRLKRLAFFREVVRETGAKGVVLAHHADDLAETAFKKLLEGVPLFALGSMKKMSEVDGLKIARPLLDFTKKELLSYLGKRGYIVDKTNTDTAFLRARMRSVIFPQLSATFGKNVEPPLAEMARQAYELAEYLEEVLKPFKVIYEGDRAHLDLKNLTSPYLLKARIHQFFKELSLPVFQSVVMDLARALLEKTDGFYKIVGNQKIIVSRGVLKTLRI